MSNQFTVFALCVGVGFVSGVPYEAFSFLRRLFCRKGKNKAVGIAADIAFFLLFAAIAVWSAYTFQFPSFRIYMWLGYAVGGIIYLKTLHRILAFLQIMCYNKVTKLIKRAKKHEKTLKKEGETL